MFSGYMPQCACAEGIYMYGSRFVCNSIISETTQ